VEIFLFADS